MTVELLKEILKKNFNEAPSLLMEKHGVCFLVVSGVFLEVSRGKTNNEWN